VCVVRGSELSNIGFVFVLSVAAMPVPLVISVYMHAYPSV